MYWPVAALLLLLAGLYGTWLACCWLDALSDELLAETSSEGWLGYCC